MQRCRCFSLTFFSFFLRAFPCWHKLRVQCLANSFLPETPSCLLKKIIFIYCLFTVLKNGFWYFCGHKQQCWRWPTNLLDHLFAILLHTLLLLLSTANILPFLNCPPVSEQWDNYWRTSRNKNTNRTWTILLWGMKRIPLHCSMFLKFRLTNNCQFEWKFFSIVCRTFVWKMLLLRFLVMSYFPIDHASSGVTHAYWFTTVKRVTLLDSFPTEKKKRENVMPLEFQAKLEGNSHERERKKRERESSFLGQFIPLFHHHLLLDAIDKLCSSDLIETSFLRCPMTDSFSLSWMQRRLKGKGKKRGCSFSFIFSQASKMWEAWN